MPSDNQGSLTEHGGRRRRAAGQAAECLDLLVGHRQTEQGRQERPPDLPGLAAEVRVEEFTYTAGDVFSLADIVLGHLSTGITTPTLPTQIIRTCAAVTAL